MIHRVRTIRSNLHFEYGVCAGSLNTFYRKTGRRQIFGEPLVIDGEIDEITNPLWRKFHLWFWL